MSDGPTLDGATNQQGQSVPAFSGTQIEGEAKCEVIATHAPVTKGSVAPVSPAVSPAVPLSNGREQLTTETTDTIHQSGSQSGNGNTKPNCYECRHRRELLGDCHSSCAHPSASPVALLLFAGGHSEMRTQSIHVRGNTHGVRSGWFMWPMNFDPVWLEICSGFEAKQRP